MPIERSVPTRTGLVDSPDVSNTGVQAPHENREAAGTSFVDTVIAADADANGLSKEELAGAMAKLKKLASDGRENDAGEKKILDVLARAAKRNDLLALDYEVKDGAIVFTFPDNTHDPLLIFTGAPEDHRPPQTLAHVGGEDVELGTDPGDFYCEHMFFSAQLEASKPGSSVELNGEGEKLVGFLHIPRDEMTGGRGVRLSEAERHRDTRQVVGAALRGFFGELLAKPDHAAPHVFLTGYDQFGDVVNNPTGDFVTHRENLDAAMANAFGAGLVTREGRLVHGKEGDADGRARTYRYVVRSPPNAPEREVLLSVCRFPVADSAIDPGGRRSVQHAMRELRPNAVLSMGVAPGATYRAEFRADSGGLDRRGAHPKHDDNASDKTRLANNYALARAIEAGVKPIG